MEPVAAERLFYFVSLLIAFCCGGLLATFLIGAMRLAGMIDDACASCPARKHHWHD